MSLRLVVKFALSLAGARVREDVVQNLKVTLEQLLGL